MKKKCTRGKPYFQNPRDAQRSLASFQNSEIKASFIYSCFKTAAIGESEIINLSGNFKQSK